jgi:hypothetical protein
MPTLSVRARIGILAALAILAYLPALRLPFIAEDFTQIPLARQFAVEGWKPLFHEVNLGPRATYMVMSALLDRTFGFNPFPFYAVSIILHALCVLLVYASGVWNRLGRPAAFWGAAFFAVQEGHQEAVMGLASSMYLLVFLFGVAAWVCWVKWLQEANWKWYAAAIVCFVLAAASNESVCSIAGLMLLPVVLERRYWRHGLTGAAPFLAMAAAYMIFVVGGRVEGPGYHDIRFSLSAPWLRILFNSLWRLLFVWGFAALAALLWVGRRTDRWLVGASMLWMIFSLLPYSFLTYMLQVPSRHTYLATAGLAWLFGTAAARLYEQRKQTALVILCVSALAVNLEILWVKKMAQFRERAEPTELLLQAAAEANGSVSIDCFPLPDFLAEAALKEAGSHALFQHPGVDRGPTCFAVEYQTRMGQVIRESKKLGTAKHGTFY